MEHTLIFSALLIVHFVFYNFHLLFPSLSSLLFFQAEPSQI